MNNMRTVQLGVRGQMVIPQDFRNALGLSEGENLVVFEFNDCLVIKKQKAVLDSLKDIELVGWMMASNKTLNKIWKDEPDGLWESYLK